MAARVIKSLHKSGSVSRLKVRAAARKVAKSDKMKPKKGAIRRADTASGRKLIAFKRASFKSAAA